MSDQPLLQRQCSVEAPLRVAVLASGSGSNLQAILDDAARGGRAFVVVVVVVRVQTFIWLVLLTRLRQRKCFI